MSYSARELSESTAYLLSMMETRHEYRVFNQGTLDNMTNAVASSQMFGESARRQILEEGKILREQCDMAEASLLNESPKKQSIAPVFNGQPQIVSINSSQSDGAGIIQNL